MDRKVYMNISDFEAQNKELGGLLPIKEDVKIMADELELKGKKLKKIMCKLN